METTENKIISERERKKKEKQQNRITVSFTKKYLDELKKLEKEKSKSDTVCKALRYYYNRDEIEKSIQQETLEKLDILTHLILDTKKEVMEIHKELPDIKKQK